MCIDTQWFNVIGLGFDMVGAFILASGLFLSKEKAITLGVPRHGSENDADNLNLPQVKDRMKQSHNAKIGMGLLLFGFLLQIIGNIPSG